MGRVRDSWGFAEGDPITRELTAMKLLGGGEAYEAYLAFDDITYGPVVVKVVRPGQVEDEAGLRGLRHRLRDGGGDAAIEDAGDDVVGRNRVDRSGERVGGGELHLARDGARADVERAAKDERETARY